MENPPPLQLAALTSRADRMAYHLPDQGLVSGPSVEEILAGSDISAFRDLLSDDGALSLFDYWCRLVREHGPKIKPHFDPIEVPRALASIYMEEWDPGHAQSRMRLMGETLKAQWRDSVVGLVTDEYVTGDANALWKQSDQVVYFEKRAAILIYSLEYIDRPHCTLIDLALPLDDENAKMFSIGYAWERT